MKTTQETCLAFLTPTQWKTALPLAEKANRIPTDRVWFISTLLTTLNNLGQAPEIAVELFPAFDSFLTKLSIKQCLDEQSILYNNAACVFKSQGKLYTAKKFLKKALKLEEFGRVSDKAQTRINFCTILSELGHHKRALSYGLKAVQFAQEDLIHCNFTDQDTTSKVTMLGVAYHNVASQHEYLKNHAGATEWYTKALNFLNMHGKEEHEGLLIEIKRCLAPPRATWTRPQSAKSRPQTAKARPQSAQVRLPLSRKNTSTRLTLKNDSMRAESKSLRRTEQYAVASTVEAAPGHFVVKLPPK